MNRHIKRRFLLFLTTALLFAASAGAQSVGVVMSGGGAKGLYHIGVLQALEENGIPIDYVSGTSMGSIIAGLYAAGYSPAEMREIVTKGNIRQWVSGRIDPNYVPYFQRATQTPAFFSIRLRLKEQPQDSNMARLQFPSHLFSSTQIDLVLAELFTPASTAAGGDFKQLMVPFLCVASDMNAREAVVFDKGDLGEAIRASMSIPLAFQPVKKDSMLLYDGGIHDNFPWKPLDKEFSPDFIIGSKCTSGNSIVTENSSIVDQAFMLAMGKTDYTLPEERSLMISHPINVNMLDFSNVEAIIEAGYKDALAQIPELKKRIKRVVTPAEAQARRDAFREKCPPLVFDHYEIEGLTPAQTTYVRNIMSLDRFITKPGQTMSFEDFRRNFFALMGNNDFSVEYPIIRYDSLRQSYSIELNMSTRPNSRVMIGGNISSTIFNQAFIGFDYHVIRRVSQRLFAGLYLGLIYSTGSIGGRTDLFYLKRPFAIDYSYNFVVKSFRHGYFGNLTPVDNVEQVKIGGNFLSLGISMPLTHNSLISLQGNGGVLGYRYYDTSPYGVNEDTDLTRFLFFGTKLELRRSTLDKILFPRKGSEVSLSGIYITGRERYKPFAPELGNPSFNTHREWFGARFKWDRYYDIPSCNWFSFGFNVEAVWTNHPSFLNPIATAISMPAYQPVLHSQMSYMPDYHAKSYLAGGLMPTFDLLPNFFLRTGFYAMLRDNRNMPGRMMQYISDVSFIYRTPIGPVSLSLTKYDLKSWNNLYLTFNFGYAIFAPSGKFY